MIQFFKKYLKLIFVTLILNSIFVSAYSEEEDLQISLEKIQQDIKTLEKAVYGANSISGAETESFENSDALTRHLLKLSEIENQFRELTNKVEQINFKIDKLSSRVSKIQSDNQLRFQDIESQGFQSQIQTNDKQKKLPGTGEASELGKITDSDIGMSEDKQKTMSIETSQAVITENPERTEKILPDLSVEERYNFAISFVKVGDYDTAEFALREFIDSHPKHNLAGNAQYWYGETFRIRQLYQDAATAYLDGYQKYPKSSKAPVNLLKLGVTLVQIGEKEQGCSMILAIENQYPKADASVLQKAKYEEKKFKCKQS